MGGNDYGNSHRHRNTLSSLAELETVLSVVVPARNSAATIGRTLAALAEQDLDDAYEVIVVDNGSDDDTALIAGLRPVR